MHDRAVMGDSLLCRTSFRAYRAARPFRSAEPSGCSCNIFPAMHEDALHVLSRRGERTTDTVLRRADVVAAASSRGRCGSSFLAPRLAALCRLCVSGQESTFLSCGVDARVWDGVRRGSAFELA